MSEIEKLYKNAGIKPVVRNNATGKGYYIEHQRIEESPTFTAEKQLELIKWLAINGEVCRIDATVKDKWFVESEYAFKTSDCLEDFTEALANLINKLWHDLTPEEKAEIKEILND